MYRFIHIYYIFFMKFFRSSVLQFLPVDRRYYSLVCSFLLSNLAVNGRGVSARFFNYMHIRNIHINYIYILIPYSINLEFVL